MLTAADPLRVAQHPVARFSSTDVRCDPTGTDVIGVLDLAGTTSVLHLHGEYAVDDAADDEAVLTATGTIATAILGGISFPGSGLLVPRTMTLGIHVAVGRHWLSLAG